ncbi:MAG: FAD-dependent oxidoreductase [Acidobacteriaceae bacterium]|nr:FAD-dependent oxidoreductase [Acidobacteriaceae bacterium]
MSARFDVAVIGAGIVGAACSLEFARAGLHVAVIERDSVASGATGAAMGHVVVTDDSPAQLALTTYAQSLWSELAPSLPASVEYYRPGTIWIASDHDEMAEVRRKFQSYRSHDIPCELLDSQALAEAEPNLRQPLSGGLLATSDAVLHPHHAAEYLIYEAQKLDAQIMTGYAVTRASRGQVFLESGETLSAGYIVNAAGALARSVSPGVPVRKRKGHLILTETYPGYAHHQLVELGYLKSAHASEADSVAFNVQPRLSGHLLIGSSRQYGAEHPGLDQHMVDAIKERAAFFMPGITGLTAIRSWTGFRAATPDKLPLIGPTEDPTVVLATGHEGLGITTSLATARLLADHLLGRPSAIPIEPYLPSRIPALQEAQ